MITNLELLSPDWFDQSAIRLPDYKVGRVSFGSGRSYVRIKDDKLEEPFRIYTSLTTAISTCAPMERPLLEWYAKLGLDEADRMLKLAQHYGSLLHLRIGQYLITGMINFDMLGTDVQQYTSIHDYWQPECRDWELKLKYDLMAFAVFCNEYQVKPLGIEYVLLSEEYGFGTLIDLVCEMTIKEKGFWGEKYKSGKQKGQPKESSKNTKIRAIINFKSGRHGFYRSNGIQMVAEKLLWEENFPDMPLDAAFNWSPKEWESSPGYNIKNWMDEIPLEEVRAIMSLAKIRFSDKAMNKKYLSISGIHYKDKDVNLCLSQSTVQEYCLEKFTAQPV